MAGILSAPDAIDGNGPGAGSGPVAPAPALRVDRWLLVVLAITWLFFSWPLLTGGRTLLARDVFTTHLSFKHYGAEALASGEIPSFDTTRALGQPFAGNPNALPFYPGNLLYLALPFWVAFNAHYVLHWLLAFLGMRLLARTFGQSAAAATFAALTFAASGYVLTLLTFYNLIAVVAWLPFVLWGVARGGRRGCLWGGAACGMMLLAGEPVTAALATVPMLLVAWERRGLRRGVVDCLVIGGIGLLIAAPQIVAAARILDFTYRGAHGLTVAQVSAHSLPPGRWLELLLPLPWGWPSNLDRFGYWSSVTPLTPYIYSFYCGVVGLAAALAAYRRWRWAALVVAGLVFGWMGGPAAEVLLRLTGGLFRFSQKFLLWVTLALALLAGWGFDRWFRERDEASTAQSRRSLGAGALLALLAALGLWFGRGPIRDRFVHELGARSHAVAATQQTQWFLGALFAALLLTVAAIGVRRNRPGLVLAAQLLALAQLLPLLTTARRDEFAPPAPWIVMLRDDPDVVLLWDVPPSTPSSNRGGRAFESETAAWRDARLDLDVATGALHGLRYPQAPDFDGIYSPLSSLLMEYQARAPWPDRLRWFRRQGVDWFVRRDDDGNPPPGSPVARDRRYGVDSELYRVSDSAGRVIWPERIVVADSPIAALLADHGTESAREETGTAVASRPVRHTPGATIRILDERFDRLRFSVEGEGGLAVVQRAFFPEIEARLADGTRLPTQPANLALLGVEVPAGRQEVVIGTSRLAEKLAGGIALLALLAALVLGYLRP